MGPTDLDRPFVAITGNIATGKSGLVERLAKTLSASPLLENIAKNPYFELFYEDPQRWAFHSQVAFAADALDRHIQSIGGGPVVQDRTVYDTIDVFARLQTQLGYLSPSDFAVLSGFRRCGAQLARQPTLLIHLQAPAPVLLERIARRNRAAERDLTASYLTQLNDCYGEFIEDWDICPVLHVDTAARDIRTPAEMQSIVSDLQIPPA